MVQVYLECLIGLNVQVTGSYLFIRDDCFKKKIIFCIYDGVLVCFTLRASHGEGRADGVGTANFRLSTERTVPALQGDAAQGGGKGHEPQLQPARAGVRLYPLQAWGPWASCLTTPVTCLPSIYQRS